jgi:hypothetical protein
MSGFIEVKQRVRSQAEHHLRVAAMEDLRGRYPAGTAAPYRRHGGLVWRYAFVPLYRRLPWTFKQRAMHALGMTAEHSGWTPPSRRPGDPWVPPARRR